ncbi:haloacid dehalogenase type II [Caldovatus aquaticus]|uniref:(S)-2-haloacid dehalogenase n=1 Tax=Caldovatus aquaticus TaxID=2865671 RepID=A0ABS7F6V4_9PROT|nr:haloacid dehalogenase type II [Caldovatus aquaticus]MBW8270546.1 haloacid dehalogenase type II [Caldovatus aquaticus]
MDDAPPRPAAVIFDAYGTLLDVHAATARHAARLGPHWRTISAEWRQKQLEYTWVRSLAGPAHHENFFLCTRDALDYVFARHGIADAALREDLLRAYRRLDAYPEVPAVLRALRAAGVPVAILSNGAPGMLAEACEAAGIAALLDAVLSVEEVGVFKPDPRVYRLAVRHFGAEPEEMAFVSANPWDAQAALANGFRAVRVNRADDPDEYALRGAGVPELRDLAPLPGLPLGPGTT